MTGISVLFLLRGSAAAEERTGGRHAVVDQRARQREEALMDQAEVEWMRRVVLGRPKPPWRVRRAQLQAG
jgi:hypothetical protein